MSIELVHASFSEAATRCETAYANAVRTCSNCDSSISHLAISQAFLQLICSWESLLEDMLVEYLLGNQSLKGRPFVLQPMAQSKEHALGMLRGGSSKDIDWLDTESVNRVILNFYCNESSYLAEGYALARPKLKEARTIRNAIAHRSSSAREKYNNLVRSSYYGHVGISVPEYLSSRRPHQRDSFFEYYSECLRMAADCLAEK